MFKEYLVDYGIDESIAHLVMWHVVEPNEYGLGFTGVNWYVHYMVWCIIKAGFFYSQNRWRGWLGQPNKWYTTAEIIDQIFKPLSEAK